MSRRNPGEGSIYQRGDGRWVGSVQLHGKRKAFYGKTAKEVREKLKALTKHTAITGAIPECGKRTVADLLDFWLDTVKDTLKPRTIADYQRVGHDYIKPHVGPIRLSQLQPEHIQKLYSHLIAKGLRRGAFHAHQTLHRALKLAVLWNWLPDNPADRVVKPSYQAERKEVWTQEDLSRFLEATEGHWLQPLWVVGISTGARIGELLALRWDNVDLLSGVLSIRRSVQRIHREWVETTCKTKAGQRSITLPGEAVEALRRQRVIQARLRLKAGSQWQDQGLVFSGEKGQPMHQSVVQHAIKRTCQKIGVKPLSPHGLRHLHASLLLAKGLPITAVSQRLGHANAAITMAVYAHALKSHDDEAARAIQAVLERA